MTITLIDMDFLPQAQPDEPAGLATAAWTQQRSILFGWGLPSVG